MADEYKPIEARSVGILEHRRHAARQRDRLGVEWPPSAAGQIDGDRRQVEQRLYELPAPRAVHSAVDEHDAVGS